MGAFQIGEDLYLMAAFTVDQLGATGLTVTFDAWGWSGGAVTPVLTDQAATEIGGGFYGVKITAAVNFDTLMWKAKTAGTVDAPELFQMHRIGQAWVENLDMAMSSLSGAMGDPGATELPGAYSGDQAGVFMARLRANGVVQTSTPSWVGLDLSLFATDTYGPGTAGGPLDWTDEAGIWPADLSGATITLYVNITGADLSFPVTIITPTPPDQRVRVSLDAADMATLPKGATYQIVAVFGDESSRTLAAGKIIVR